MLITFFKEFQIFLLEHFFINDKNFIKKIELFVEVKKDGERELSLIRTISALSFLNKFKKKIIVLNGDMFLRFFGKELTDYFIFFMFLLQDSRVDMIFNEESNSIVLEIIEYTLLQEIIPVTLMKDIIKVRLEIFFSKKFENNFFIDLVRFLDEEKEKEKEDEEENEE